MFSVGELQERLMVLEVLGSSEALPTGSLCDLGSIAGW